MLRGSRPASARALAHEADAPLDQVRVGELEDDAVGDAPGQLQRLRAVAGDPDRQRRRCAQVQLDLLALVVDRLARGQLADSLRRRLKVGQRRRLLAQHAPRAVAAPDAEVHAPAGDAG